ncbi:hypothetical protein QZH41_018150, partial [Actinostola sp. cb2023]
MEADDLREVTVDPPSAVNNDDIKAYLPIRFIPRHKNLSRQNDIIGAIMTSLD